MTQKRDKIVLVGFMGTGKSTVARLLAEKLETVRVDLDSEIECREGRKISGIFAEDGERRFRSIETSVLESVMRMPGRTVIATGGGAVLEEENRELMKKYGLVVALTADAAHIIARVKHDTARPLLAGDVEERVHKLLEERKYAYDFADLTIDTSQMSANEAAAIILKEIEPNGCSSYTNTRIEG